MNTRTRSLIIGAAIGLAILGQVAPVHAVSCWTTPHTFTAEVVTVTQLNAMTANDACLKTSIEDDGTIYRSRRLSTDTTAVGNVGGGTDNLIVATYPAGTLSANGQTIRVKADFTFAANSNTKTLTFQFGATTFTITNSSINNQTGIVTVTIIRTGASSQRVLIEYVQSNNGNSAGTQVTTAAENLAADKAIAFTGASGGSATNDIVQGSMVIWYDN